jgi:cutinase
MKTCARSLLALAALASTTLAAPTQAKGVSFPVTDVIGTGLTIDEYAAKLESEGVQERDLTKRQYNSDTYNQLTDGTACRPVSLIWARGTTSPGNVGEAGSEGPTFFNAVAARVGGINQLAIQGVNYPANVLGFLAGGDAQGATTMYNLINQVSTFLFW